MTAIRTDFFHFHIMSFCHVFRKQRCVMCHYRHSSFIQESDDFWSVSQGFISFLFSFELILHLFFLSFPQLPSGFIQNFIDSCLFLSLYLFFQVLFTFTLFLFSANDFSCFVNFFAFTRSTVRKLNEIFGFSFLSFSFVV